MTFSKITKLGEGFFGEVWREHDNGLDRDCAAKYLDLSKLAPSADVFAEAKLMIDAKHDHVVEVYSADFEAGTPVIRMEYLLDRSVADRFAGQPAPPAAVVTIIQDACRGVEHLHSRGLLHRDIKPANLLLGPAGVKVSDFGLACTQSAAATAVDIRYDLHCPPETLAIGGAIETREGDVWALGMTAYRLLCGDGVVLQAASDADDFADAVTRGKFPPKDRFPIYVHDKLRNTVLAALRPNPATRLQSAAKLRHRLEQAEPYVSWRLDGTDDRKWIGDAQDECEWSVTIAERPRGGWQVIVQRAQPGKPSRRITDDCVNVSGLDAAREHAGTVMRRVATSNR